MKKLILVLISTLFVFNFSLTAETKDWKENVPQELKQWIPWVLRDYKPECTYAYNNQNQKFCTWESALELELDSKGGQFRQNIIVEKKSFFYLPGNKETWPQNVTVDQKPYQVLDRYGNPLIELDKGQYQIAGEFFWSEAPSKLKLAAETGLIKLLVNNKKVLNPSVDSSGYLWVKQNTPVAATKKVEKDYLNIRLFRLIEDTIPAKLTTWIYLDVGGNEREIIVPDILLNSKPYQAQELNRKLPVQIDRKNKLHLQATAGNYLIKLQSTLPAPLETIIRPEFPESLPAQSIWAIAEQPLLRNIQINGLKAVNPTHLEIPHEIKNYPLYIANAKDQLSIQELKRAGKRALKNDLTLDKTIKLHFDGKAYSVTDRIQGQIYKAGRLEIEKDYKVGNVKINDQEQLISKISKGQQGVEVREGQITLTGDSRLERKDRRISATGWLADFNSANVNLHLPAGYRALHISGADKVSNTWTSSWTLYDVFLVLVTSIVAFKIFSPLTGLIFTVGLVLIEPDFNIALYLLSLMILGLIIKLIKEQSGFFVGLIKFVYRGTMIVFVLYSIIFIIDHVKTAFYPQLQNISTDSHRYYPGSSQLVGSAHAPAQRVQKMTREPFNNVVGDSMREELDGYAPKVKGLGSGYSITPQKQYAFNPKDNVQTGYGVSSWSNQRNYRKSVNNNFSGQINLSWSGPLSNQQDLEVYLISPNWNLLLALIRVVLLATLIAIVISGRKIFTSLKSSTASMLLLCSLITAPQFSKAEIPDQAILNDLRNYARQSIDEPPTCLPACGSIESLKVSNQDDRLMLIFKINTASDTAIPLVSNLKGLSVDSIKQQQQDLHFTRENNTHWIKLEKGISQIQVNALLLEDSASIDLPLLPGFSSTKLQDWKIYGINSTGKTDYNLKFVRIQKAVEVIQKKADQQAKKTVQVQTLNPLINIQRALTFGVQWQAHTTVTRQSGFSSTSTIQIPIIKTERVTNADFKVKNGFIELKFAPGETHKVWNSIIPQANSLHLQASKNEDWSETWQLNVTNLWHATFSGSPQVQSDHKIPNWKPRPGEELQIALERPQGVAGPTRTIDQVTLKNSVGKRITNSNLSYSVRSSKGELHEFSLPKDAEFVSLSIDGKKLPGNLKNNLISIPLRPGSQEVALEWKMKEQIPLVYSNQTVDLNTPIVNLKTEINMPKDRWILYTSGPLLGPAVLFWGLIPSIILFAWILARTKLSPLGFWSWLILMTGISLSSLSANILIIFFLLIVGYRGRKDLQEFKLRRVLQIFLVVIACIAASALIYSVKNGLLGSPSMLIKGNGSYSSYLKWYQDVSSGELPTVEVISLSMTYYRVIMLLWALWLSFALVNWSKWSWDCFSKGGVWIKKVKQKAATSDSSTPEA